MKFTVQDEINHLKNKINMMNPEERCYGNIEYEDDYKKIKKLESRTNYIDLLKCLESKYHVTITFKAKISKYVRDLQIKKIIKMINKDYFGKNMEDDHLEGFVVEEKHKSGLYHYHLLLAVHDAFKNRRNKNKQFETILKRKCKAMKLEKYMRYTETHTIDYENGVKVQEYYEGNLEEYLTKTLEKNRHNTSFIGIMDRSGFIDNN